MELKEGQRLRVKEFDESPEHWNWDGEMNKWMGKIVTLKDIDDEYLIIYEDKGKWAWKESDFQIVFDTWTDVYNMMRNECLKYDAYCYNDECHECKLKKYAGVHYECYTDLFNSKDYKKLAENFEKMFGMECYVLENKKMKKEFTKSDLKDGMVIEYRGGERRMLFGEKLKGINMGTGNSLENYKEDLIYLRNFYDLDIIKVYDDRNENISIKDMITNPKKLIWKREKEQVTRNVSLEEINALLKEKYPDVEKFNLPIDNDK